jgi:hypothetical protein
VEFSLENASAYGGHNSRTFYKILEPKFKAFFPTVSKLRLIAKFVFDTHITCLDSRERRADVAKWQTQRT